MAPVPSKGGPTKGPKCPICGKPVERAFRPFCSARCKQVDLNRWFTESYRVPAQVVVDEEEDLPTRPDQRDDDT